MKIYKVGCKVNLNLHIIGRRDFGYHQLDSIFYPVQTPYDTIGIDDNTKGAGLEVFCDSEGMIDLENNTITQIYAQFADLTGYAPDLIVVLEKGIPYGAGLGGGSADAAFFLKYLYTRFMKRTFTEKIKLCEKDIDFLQDIALEVGSDLPFFLHNKPMRVEEIGEVCTPTDLSALKGCYLLLIYPRIVVHTAQVYKKFREENKIFQQKMKKNDTESLTRAIKNAIKPDSTKEKNSAKAFFTNDLEPYTFALYPQLKEYKAKMLEQGAIIALMSGSGSSSFGIFTTKESAEKAKSAFSELNVDVFPIIEL